MSPVDRVERLASQLLGDLNAVEGVTIDRHAADQQRLQLILDAFEQVGLIALGTTDAKETAETATR